MSINARPAAVSRNTPRRRSIRAAPKNSSSSLSWRLNWLWRTGSPCAAALSPPASAMAMKLASRSSDKPLRASNGLLMPALSHDRPVKSLAFSEIDETAEKGESARVV